MRGHWPSTPPEIFAGMESATSRPPKSDLRPGHISKSMENEGQPEKDRVPDIHKPQRPDDIVKAIES